MTKAWIVWNHGKTEGVIFKDGPPSMGKTPHDDALETKKGKFRGAVSSSLGEAFVDLYDDKSRSIQEVEI